MKMLIVGSNGFIGRPLADKLKNLGFQVVEMSSADGSGIDPVTGLLPRDFSFPKGVSTVIYLAQSPLASKTIEGASHSLSVNCVSAVRLASMAIHSKVQRFVYLSTGNVYAPSFDRLYVDSPVRRDNLYSLSKVHAEEALTLLRDQCEMIVVRPFGVFGDGQKERLIPNLIKKVQMNEIISLHPSPSEMAHKPNETDGLRISLIHIEDAVDILATIAIEGGVNYLNLAGPEISSIQSLAQKISRLSGKESSFIIEEDCRETDYIADFQSAKEILGRDFISIETGLTSLIGSSVA